MKTTASRYGLAAFTVSVLLAGSGLAMAAKKKPARAGAAAAAKAPPTAKAEAIAALRGEFKWGMNLDEVATVIEKRLRASFEPRLKETASDPIRQERVRKQLREEVEGIKKSYVEFTGKTTGYDVSIVDQEFAHRVGESMLPAKEDKATRYFFFADGRLYKMFIAFDKERVGDKSFEEFGEIMQAQFGKAREVEVEITRKGETRKLLDYYEWRTDAGEGLRLVDRSGFYGVYCLVLYDRSVEDRLAAAHAESRKRGGGREALVEAVLASGRAESDVNADIIDQITGETHHKPGTAPTQDIVVPSTTGLAPSAAEVNAAGRSGRGDPGESGKAATPSRRPGKADTSGLEL